MQLVVLIGRILYSAIFILSSFHHFSKSVIGFAESQGVPMASILVPLSGIMALLGGLSILLGYKARWGALLLILFLVPVTLMMHHFWDVSDPQEQQMQMILFMKNLSMLGAALLLLHFGSGPLSLDKKA